MYFQGLLGLAASSRLIGKYLPDQVEWWGKMCFKGDAECIKSHWAHESVRETYHEAFFARVSASNSSFNCVRLTDKLELVIDEYEDDPG